MRSAPDAEGAELVALRDRARDGHGGPRRRRRARASCRSRTRSRARRRHARHARRGPRRDDRRRARDRRVAVPDRARADDARAIERVVSHPQPLAQCARFLRDHLPAAEVVAVASTAEAVRVVAAEHAPWAALGTRRAAELYGAKVLADGAEDEPGNATRFVWLARAARREPTAGGEQDVAGLLGRRRRQPRLARALPVGVRVSRREPHEDRVAAAARPARALPLLRRLRGRRARGARRRRRRRPARALRARARAGFLSRRRLRGRGARVVRLTRNVMANHVDATRPIRGSRRIRSTGGADVTVAACSS